MHKSIYECKIIQFLLPEEAAIICQKICRVALILQKSFDIKHGGECLTALSEGLIGVNRDKLKTFSQTIISNGTNFITYCVKVGYCIKSSAERY